MKGLSGVDTFFITLMFIITNITIGVGLNKLDTIITMLEKL